MSPREDLQETAAALGSSVVVCGVGSYADALAGQEFPDARFATVSEIAAEGAHAAAAVVVAVGSTTDTETDDALRTLAATDAFTVAIVPGSDASTDELSAISDQVDAVLLVGDGRDSRLAGGAGEAVRTGGVSEAGKTDEAGEAGGAGEVGENEAIATADSAAVGDAIRSFLAVVQEPGFVNLDLTDAQTVLSSGIAALGAGTAARDAPAIAVESAFDGLPAGVDPTDASAVLVDVVVDPVTSISAATDVIAAVRDRIGTDANVIWGGAVNESAADELNVRIVVADVYHSPPLAAGDPCPRCDAPLSAYQFGARETLSCDACGYSGIAVRRG